MKILHSFLALCLLSNFIFAGTIDPNTSDTKYIEYGNKFPFIGQFLCMDLSDNVHIGSVVAHQDNIILTAAHVIHNTKKQLVMINERIIPVKDYVVHEKYKMDEYGYFDIAVAILDKPIGLGWYPDLYEDRDEVSKLCSLSGFGMTGTFNTGAILSDSKKRAGSNYIDAIDRGLLVCNPSVNNRTALEFLIASGDSGGGLFIGNKVAGIHSCVMSFGRKSYSEYGSESGHTRISDHCEWIRNTIIKLKELADEKKKKQ